MIDEKDDDDDGPTGPQVALGDEDEDEDGREKTLLYANPLALLAPPRPPLSPEAYVTKQEFYDDRKRIDLLEKGYEALLTRMTRYEAKAIEAQVEQRRWFKELKLENAEIKTMLKDLTVSIRLAIDINKKGT